MRAVTALRWLVRESRGARGRLVFFTACLAVGVAAVVGTSAVARGIHEAFRQRSREILGADLKVDAHRPLPDALADVVAAFPGAERCDIVESASMLRAPGGVGAPARLARIVAVSGRYPLRGELVTEPPGGLAAHLRGDTLVAPRDLLVELSVDVGDEVLVAGRPFRIAAVVVREPPSFGFSSFLGSRAYVGGEALERLPFLKVGSRVTFRALVALPAGRDDDAALRRFEARVRALPDSEYLSVDRHDEIGPGGGRTVRQRDGFLGLTALLSLLVGGIGVAQIVRAWLGGRTRALAVLRCLGVRPVEILALTVGHVLLLALAGSVVGALAGLAVPLAARGLLGDVVPGGTVFVVPWYGIARGIALGALIAVTFSLPAATAIWRVPPVLALRADAAPLPAPRIVRVLTALALVAGIVLAALAQSPRAEWAFAFAAAVVGVALVLAAAAHGLVAVARRVPRRRLHRALAHALAAVARPGAGTVGSVVALGLGTLVVATTWIAQSRLRDGLLAEVPADAPSVFLVDVQGSQQGAVRAALDAARATSVDEVPVVTARIAAVDGVPLESLAAERGKLSWRLTREQRITTRAVLPSDNRVVAGALWSDPSRLEVSVEQRYAEEAGLRLGSVVTFDVQGVLRDLVVTSIREVRWQSLGINFFLVAEPGALDDAPALRLISARVPPDAELALQARIAADAQNVTVVRIGPLLDQVGALVGRFAAGVGVLGGFASTAGLLVLAGAAAATALRRRREVALLKVLGVTRGGIALLFALEHGLVGVLAGLVGATGAYVLAGGFLAYVVDVDLGPPLLAIPVAALACGALTALCGLAASRPALRAPPVDALRRGA